MWASVFVSVGWGLQPVIDPQHAMRMVIMVLMTRTTVMVYDDDDKRDHEDGDDMIQMMMVIIMIGEEQAFGSITFRGIPARVLAHAAV